MQYNTIIFDVDGTLLNTRSGIILSVRYVINKFSLNQISEDDLYDFVGISPLQAAFCQFCNIDIELAQKCSEEFRTFYNEKEIFNATVYNGIIDLLDFLKNNNYRIGIATYKREDLVRKLLKYFELGNYFDVICGADNNNKLTKADMLQKCVDSLNTKKENIIMIGDSLHDAQAAEKLGVKFIGVTYGFGFKTTQDVNAYPNILCANTPKDILEYIKANYAESI